MKIKNRRTEVNEHNGLKQDVMEVGDVEIRFDYGGLQDHHDCNPDSLCRNMRTGFLQGRTTSKCGEWWTGSESFINAGDCDLRPNFDADVEKWKMEFVRLSLKVFACRKRKEA